MDRRDFKEEMVLAVEAVKLAANVLLDLKTSDLKVNSEVDKDIKLEADILAEKVLVEYLSKKTSYNILSEESGFVRQGDKNDLAWIIDPLDGTLNYSRGLDICAISLALWDGENPVLGVIYDFLNNKLFRGIVGDCAYCNEKKIVVSNISQKSKGIIATGFPVYLQQNDESVRRFIEDIREYKKVRLLGSAAQSLAMVAQGSVEVYYENDIAIWDVAAGLAIVKAAGGDYQFRRRDNTNIMRVHASNAKIK